MLTIENYRDPDSMQISQKKFPGVGQWDSVNSTYKHQIYLTNNKILTGYSKGLYVSEPSDKIVLLERMVVRLTGKGYLNEGRVHRIEWFLNKYLEGNDEHILTLYPKTYTMGKVERFIVDFRLQGFLKKFYLQLQSGSKDLKSGVHKPVISTEESDLSWKASRFPTPDKLHEYVMLMLKKYEQGAVMNFYQKYCDLHFTSKGGAL